MKERDVGREVCAIAMMRNAVFLNSCVLRDGRTIGSLKWQVRRGESVAQNCSAAVALSTFGSQHCRNKSHMYANVTKLTSKCA